MRGEKVHTITDLLAKYKKLQAPQGAVTDVFARVVKEVLCVEISKKALTFTVSTRVMYVALSGPIKQELRLNAKKILLLCARELGEASAPKSLL